MWSTRPTWAGGEPRGHKVCLGNEAMETSPHPSLLPTFLMSSMVPGWESGYSFTKEEFTRGRASELVIRCTESLSQEGRFSC